MDQSTMGKEIENADIPRYLESANLLGLKTGMSGKELLRQVRATSIERQYPTAECYLPNEVLDYEQTGSLPAHRARHMDECGSCRALMSTLVPDPLRVQEFRQAVLARRAQEEHTAHSDHKSQWSHLIFVFGALMVAAWQRLLGYLMADIAGGRRLGWTLASVAFTLGVLVFMQIPASIAEHNGVSSTDTWEVISVPETNQSSRSLTTTLNNWNVSESQFRHVAAFVVNQDDLNPKVMDALAESNRQSSESQEIKISFTNVYPSKVHGNLRISYPGLNAELGADALKGFQYERDLTRYKGGPAVLPSSVRIFPVIAARGLPGNSKR